MANKKNKNQERKKKVNLVFDESKRKDFLCGFRKRKLERKKKAQEDIQRLLKEERKRIKQENKESYKKLVVSSRPIPDIEQLLKEEYEDEEVNVKIVELSSDTLQKKNLVIGENRPNVKVDKEVKNIKEKEDIEVIKGMGLQEENELAEESDNEGDTNLKTKKDIKRILKKQATKNVQKSKVFQMKSKLDRVKNKKKSAQQNRHNNKKKVQDPRKGSNKNKVDPRRDNNKKKVDPRKDKSKKRVGKRKH